MPDATPAIIRSWVDRLSVLGLGWMFGSRFVSGPLDPEFSAVVFMALAFRADQEAAIGKNPDPTLTRPDQDQGMPGWLLAGYFGDDGHMVEQGQSWQNWQDTAEPEPPTARDHGRAFMERLESLGLRLTRGPGHSGPFRRAVEGRLAGGVAAGLANRTGFDVTTIRLALVILTVVSSGLCAAAYIVTWLVVPSEGSDHSIGSKALSDRRGIALSIGVMSALVVALIIASALNAGWITNLAVPLVVCAGGLVLIWRNAPDAELQYLSKFSDPVGMAGGGPRSRWFVRVLVGFVLLGIGLFMLLSGHERLALLRPIGGIIFVVLGFAMTLGPWWLRIAKSLVDERQARIRAEERAEMASRVHDSVLQTLALIQRRSADPHQVTQLARAQERELRAWLFDGRAPGSTEGQAVTVADGVRLIQQEVEAQHGMSVDAVTVGDCELDDDLRGLLAAAREATVNAAKWSRADVVSLFAEVEPESVSLYVRDRGRGFDPEAVPDDRKGLAESIHARMARRGGTATVRSALGEGTEVSLSMPRAVADRVQRWS